MQESQIHVYARELWKAQGPKAIAEAAHKAAEFEKKSDREQADRWRRIEAILMQMRGPHQAYRRGTPGWRIIGAAGSLFLCSEFWP
jgi:hypothetical protein